MKNPHIEHTQMQLIGLLWNFECSIKSSWHQSDEKLCQCDTLLLVQCIKVDMNHFEFLMSVTQKMSTRKMHNILT